MNKYLIWALFHFAESFVWLVLAAVAAFQADNPIWMFSFLVLSSIAGARSDLLMIREKLEGLND